MYFRASAFGAPSDIRTFFENIHNDFPEWLLTIFYEYVPGARMVKLRQNRTQVHNLLNGLIQDKKTEQLQGKKDVMSVLGRVMSHAFVDTMLISYVS